MSISFYEFDSQIDRSGSFLFLTFFRQIDFACSDFFHKISRAEIQFAEYWPMN